MTQSKPYVAVTSRSAEDNALWILNHLRSDKYKRVLGKVNYLPISNRNQKEWREEVKKNSSVILYHTARHGRLNVTDVTDSLYDSELRYMSKTLGRENVLVVLDHLQKSDEEDKRRILQAQPSISQLASHLLLFTDKEHDPVPEDKQKILLDTFTAAQKKQVSHVQWKYIIPAIGTITLLLLMGRRFYRRKGLF